MSPLEALSVLLAGLAAGTINAVVGSGSLITFPTLLWVGYPPVLANVSNSLGLVAGGVTGALGYRADLAGQRRRLWVLASASALGGVAGALLLLRLPAEVFDAVVPALVLLGVVLVVVQPWLVRRLGRSESPHRAAGPVTWSLTAAVGVYGGYFGAAQGVLLVAVLALTLGDSLQRVNAAKNVLAAITNAVAGAVFLLVTEVAWLAVALIAAGSLVGGLVGARVGQRLPDPLLRGVIVVVGLVAVVALLR